METNSNSCVSDYILILKSLAVNLPVLHSWGYVFPRLLRVVVEPGMQARTVDTLKVFDNYACNENWSSEFRFYVTNVLSKEVVKKERMNLYERNAKDGILAVITDNPLVDDEDGDYFYVFLEDREYRFDYKIKEIVPRATDLDAIYDKLRSYVDNEMMEEERILRAAVYFLEPYFFRRNELHRIRELLEAVGQMCVDDENSRNAKDISQLFLNQLFDWQMERKFNRIWDIDKELELDADFNEIIFYDSKAVYIPEKIFKKIVAPLREYAPINLLKRGLRDKNIISAAKNGLTNVYTSKITILGNGYTRLRVRMLKFERKYLSISGSLDFVDMCYLTDMGGKEDE